MFGDANCFKWFWWDDLSTPVKVCHYHINAPDCLRFFGLCSFTSSPLPTCWECCLAAGRARRGLTSKPQSWSHRSQVPSPVIWKCWVGGKGFSELWNTLGCRLCSMHSGGRRVSSAACLGLNSQQNTYLVCHALLLTPLSTASLTWCLKGSYNAHLSLLGKKLC